MIGKNLFAWGLRVHCFHSSVFIGNDNLFAENVQLMPSDGHFIRYLADDRLLNPPAPIRIGSRNWIGRNVTFLRGSGIGDSSVVGLGSIVTRRFEKHNIVIAGSPARVLHEGIYWCDNYRE